VTIQKRIFDIGVSLILILILSPLLFAIGLVVVLLDGWPVFYVSERMKGLGQPFSLIKFRTMKLSSEDSGVSGGDKVSRVTPLGRVLRASRLDETPQLWNVLRGDMSFVGPRPPLRQYVERFPELYGQVLKSRPGVTGLASLLFHRHEEMLLEKSRSRAETDEIYTVRCIPRKARFDLIYASHQSLCFDLRIMVMTVISKLRH
jgi:lipopolysaccharide/colanic/teichoic acid biosynthesis glycosyltransferase